MRIHYSFSAAAFFAALLMQQSVVATPVSAAEQRPASLTVSNAWSRSTAPGAAVGVVYFEVVNSGAADVLLSIQCPAAQRVEMHSTTVVAGLMQMRQVQSVDIPAGGRVVFGPGGLHAMLIELKGPLREGERLPLTLVFRRAGSVRAEALIQGLGTMAPAIRDGVGEPHG